MSITTLTNDQLNTLILNYKKKGVSLGGIYSLKDAKAEKDRRRSPSSITTDKAFELLLMRSLKSRDGLMTYKELWDEIFPGYDWVGNSSQRKLGAVLGDLIKYCVTMNFPVVTCLVVRKGQRQLDEAAMINIAGECKKLGLTVNVSPKEFCYSQEREARKLAYRMLQHVTAKSVVKHDTRLH